MSKNGKQMWREKAMTTTMLVGITFYLFTLI